MGKILSEGMGEVQEMIDMADLAVGMSRQLYGLSMHSERPLHRMYEQWHPLGPIGIVTAFNFPVAVWSWNCALAAVCGDVTLWKPSSKTPLTAIAVPAISPPPPNGTITIERSAMSSSSSRPIVPCPATTAGSSNGEQNAMPVSVACAWAASTAALTSAPVSVTVAP